MTETDIPVMPDDEDDLYYFEIGPMEVTIDDEAWVEETLHVHLQTAIQKIGQEGLSPFSLLLTNDTHIQHLNHTFRDKDKPTNVLSFLADDNDYMGDIAVSFNTIQKEAEAQDKAFYHHFIHMLVHGILHLKGHDHIDDTQAETMESLEVKILADMGIKNPYI